MLTVLMLTTAGFTASTRSAKDGRRIPAAVAGFLVFAAPGRAKEDGGDEGDDEYPRYTYPSSSRNNPPSGRQDRLSL